MFLRNTLGGTETNIDILRICFGLSKREPKKKTEDEGVRVL